MILALLFALLPIVWTNDGSDWSKEVVARQGVEPVVRFQSRLDGDYLIVRATHEKGWHTYAMDNELLAAEALKGKASLGIEQGIAFKVERGLELDERWLQSKPIDFSKPELRWFTYGFERTSYFACRVTKVTSDQVMLRVRGQACSGETCCQVDVRIEFQAGNSVDEKPRSDKDPFKEILKNLVPVKSQLQEAVGNGSELGREQGSGS